ncbi:MAG TPA: hypothetical protein VG982_00295 [Candidatus Paceibacterota bacterium]|jgi:hypothetical protein|nr:hypothetical protein [Candidatus Paceibacterota bacterium]
MKPLLIYQDLSTDKLDDLKRGLKEKFDDENLLIYNVEIKNSEAFLEQAKEGKPFDFVFYETSIPMEKIEKLHINSARVIKGVTLDDEEVRKFLFSL